MDVIRQATFVFILTIEASALSVQKARDDHDFKNYIVKHGRTYVQGSKEYEDRRQIFESRTKAITHHNSKTARLWNAAINHLSDRTETELARIRGLRPMRATGQTSSGAVKLHRQGSHFLHQVRDVVVPKEVSWTNLSSVNTEANQDACGSCWAVATATMLWANSEIKGYSRTFSAQELVNCVPNPHQCGGTGGCQGSTTELAMNWVMENSLASSDTTPYSGQDGSCAKTVDSTSLLMSSAEDSLQQMIKIGYHSPKSQDSRGLVELGLQGWERLPENEYEPLLKAVAFTGPVAVSVAASDWSGYGSGIFDECGRDAVVDHAVTLIGYGIDAARDNTPYWLIKNSWGSSWGEDGNIRLLRHTGDPYCGTDYQPEVGTGCLNGPSSVKVCGMCGILYDSVVAHFRPVA